MLIPYRILINNAYMDYLELRLTEIMQNKLKKRIHFELIATSTSRDDCQVSVVKDVSNQQENQTSVCLKLNYNF